MNRNKNCYAQAGNCQDRMENWQDCQMDCKKEYDWSRYPIGMSYVPWQKWREVVDGCKGLEQGTIFNELSLGFHCANKNCGNSCMPAKLPDSPCVQNVVDCGCKNNW